MKVLLIGSGGREHALAWALNRSPRSPEIVCAPGNAGIADLARLVPIDQHDLEAMVRLAEDEHPDLVVVGPELPLSLGLVDRLQEIGIPAFGPSRKAAMLETSKSFAKRFMQRHNIPTATYVAAASAQEALDSLDLFHFPVVVKADGLAAGKGVVVCATRENAVSAIHGLFDGKLLGQAETSIVIEEFLEGEEVSFLTLTDGVHIAPLVPAQDHKRVGDGDTGPNTGGMGAYTTDGMLDSTMEDWIIKRIAMPAIEGMAAEGNPFVGVLYLGLMMTARGPMMLEFNARFGDPETQAILPRLESDLVDVLGDCVTQRLSSTALKWNPGASVCVIAASAGYPAASEKGRIIHGIEDAKRIPGIEVFHAGTARDDGQYVTAGGRVLGVTATAASLDESLAKAYEAIGCIHFEGMHYRHDIGRRARKR